MTQEQAVRIYESKWRDVTFPELLEFRLGFTKMESQILDLLVILRAPHEIADNLQLPRETVADTLKNLRLDLDMNTEKIIAVFGAMKCNHNRVAYILSVNTEFPETYQLPSGRVSA